MSWQVSVSDLDPLPTEDQLYNESIGFRRERNLRSDETYVRGLLNDPANDAGRDRYGVPLTPQELQQMDAEHGVDDDDAGSASFSGDTIYPEGSSFREAAPADAAASTRAQSTSSLDPTDQYGVAHPDVYAGSYRNAGTILVGFTRDADYHLSQLRQLTSTPLALFAASRTKQDLETLRDRIVGDDAVLQADGVLVQLVATNIPDNVVDVGVAGLTEAKRQLLLQRYGPALSVRGTDIVSTQSQVVASLCGSGERSTSIPSSLA